MTTEADTTVGASTDKGPHLGRMVPGSETYDPSLLFPVPRSNARQTLPEQAFLAHGEDVWHAYELSWLNQAGVPQMCVGAFVIPATSPNIVESKSLKLYLNSLNNHRFDSPAAAVAQICADVSQVVGEAVELQIDEPGGALLAPVNPPGAELTDEPGQVPANADAELLTPVAGDDQVYTHRMRSLCPVTAQPDWATVIIETRGRHADRRGLLAYLLAYRNHQEFHEQCVERIFTDMAARIQPDFLSVHALYTRRGGLDISPWRCSEPIAAPRWRLSRQ